MDSTVTEASKAAEQLARFAAEVRATSVMGSSRPVSTSRRAAVA